MGKFSYEKYVSELCRETMKFRPCIDIRQGKVVQIVGSTLSGEAKENPVTNFETTKSPEEFARLYQSDNLVGGHVISLGQGNFSAVINALKAYPGGLQAGGGITADNARKFLDAGASHVIVTSHVFRGGNLDVERLENLKKLVGKDRLVLDLSCRKRGDDFLIVTDRWQQFTSLAVNRKNLDFLAGYCDEFLVHGVDAEGKMQGVQKSLVAMLGSDSPVPVTYAGGVSSMDDIELVNELGKGRVDLTIGSALDIFGGHLSYGAVLKKFDSMMGTQSC